MSDPDLSQQLEAPLALLKSFSETAYARGQNLSSSQLRVQLTDLQSAVSEVFDIAANALNDLLEQVEDELTFPGYAMETARQQLHGLSEELQDQLGTLSDVLLAAESFEELGDAREDVEAVEQAMQGSLARLESLLDRLLDGQLEQPLAEASRVEETSAVLELLGAALTSVDNHLADGEMIHLQGALEQVENAASILRLALAQAEEDAIRLALARAEADPDESAAEGGGFGFDYIDAPWEYQEEGEER
jgi:hypothetical protein